MSAQAESWWEGSKQTQNVFHTQKDLRMETIKVILQSILSFIWNRRVVALEGKARPYRKPWRPSTRQPGHTPTHTQSGSLCHLFKERGQSARHFKVMSWSAPKADKAIYTFKLSSGPGKRAACYPGVMIFSQVTGIPKFLKLGSQIKASKTKRSPWATLYIFYF